MAAVYNYADIPTMKLWYNPLDTHDWRDYIFLGSSVHKADNVMPPGPQLLDGIAGVGDNLSKIEHVLEIRIDDIPTEQVEVRNIYAAQVEFRDVLHEPDPMVGRCDFEANALREAQVKVDKIEERIMELQGDLGEEPPGWKRDNFIAELKNIRNNELTPAKAALDAAKIAYSTCMSFVPPLIMGRVDLDTANIHHRAVSVGSGSTLNVAHRTGLSNSHVTLREAHIFYSSKYLTPIGIEIAKLMKASKLISKKLI